MGQCVKIPGGIYGEIIMSNSGYYVKNMGQLRFKLHLHLNIYQDGTIVNSILFFKFSKEYPGYFKRHI
jgi:hypothetical protein